MTVTIEKTSKTLKFYTVLFAVMMLLGLACLHRHGEVSPAAGAAAFVGGIGFLVTRIMVWWRHG